LGWKLLRERLTHEIADHGKLIEEVEELGMTKTIEQGIQNLELKKQLHSKHVLSGQDIIVGVNKYRLEKKIHSRCG
jgi:methylmalonyl-CoA mutase